MAFPKLPPLAIARCVTLLGAGVFLASVVSAQPAQSPLLSKTGTGVSPNIMLTLDDSGSMAFRHMPENVFAGGTYATANPVGTNTVRWDKNDGYQTGTNFMGTVPGKSNTTRYVLKALRSPDTNTLYYNPEVRYLPWATEDGVTRMANSPPAKAYEDPLDQTGASGTYIDLTTTYTVNSGTSGYCYANTSSACVDTNNSFTHDPGLYFRLNYTTVSAGSFVASKSYTIKTVGTTNFTLIGAASNTVGLTFTATGAGSGTGTATSTAYTAITDVSNYTAYTINGAASTTYTKFTKRTDCVTVANACNQTEERQNFANWYSYYRTRNLMARGAMMEAFWKATNTFRLGWGRINDSTSNSIDGISSTVIAAGVRDFTGTTKTALFTWLKSLPASGSTPLPNAMDKIGKYYSRTDKQGPYTDDPSVNTNTVANNKTCRRSYHILTTDGYWNSAASSLAGNNDNEDGVTITGTGKSYKYVATKPYSDATADTLADYAMKYWKTDLQPETDPAHPGTTGMANNVAPVGDDVSFWQNMTNFTVGLGVRGTMDPDVDLPALTAGTTTTAGTVGWPAATTSTAAANVDDLWHAAVNSRGQYFSAKDPSELASAIQSALNLSAGGSGTTAGVATASTVLENTNRKYVPSYIGGEWSGDISAKPLDIDGQATSSVWNAASKWPVKPAVAGGTDWNQRKIFTWDAGLGTPQAVAFTWGGISSANQLALGSVAATQTTSFVNFLRGDHTKEGVSQPFRLRLTGGNTPFVLGDFINSNPVFVQKSVDLNYGTLATGGSTYQAFLTTKAARTGVLFVGANDGMLHAFKDSKTAGVGSTDGEEVFAYVPRAVYPNLWELTDKDYGSVSLPHRYFVDGWQRETDAYIKAIPSAGAASWRNYLMGSLGAGARAVYALDVTDTANLGAATVRWEMSDANDSDLGYVMSPIEVGVLPNGKWVAIFGNGIASTAGKAVLFVVDLELAATNMAGAITKLTVGSAGSNGLGGVGVMKNASGEITRLYAGDLNGYMWRMDYDAAATSKFKVWEQSGTATAVFQATNALGAAQPITQAPLLYNHSLGGTLLVFGTGKLFTTTDATDVSRQSMYGVWDKDPDSTVTRNMSRSNLEARTLSKQTGTGSAVFYTLTGTAVNWTTQRGWFVDLFLGAPSTDIPGLRVLYPPQMVTYELALISTVAPAQTAVVCENNSGSGINFMIEVERGADPSFNLYDTNGDGLVNGSDALSSGYATNADGIDSIVYSPAKTGSNLVGDGAVAGGGTVCAPGYYRVSIQNTTGQLMTCVRRTPSSGGGSTTMKDRFQRRIINPPIH